MDKSIHDELIFTVKGHPNITGMHKSTWQITRETQLTPKGNCIIGVESEFACYNLPLWLKSHLLSGGKILVELNIDEHQFKGTAEGHSDLLLEDRVDMVFRKSKFISPRTVAINSSFAATQIPITMLNKMKIPGVSMKVRITKF